MRYVLIAIASAAALFTVGAAFLLYPSPEKPTPVAPTPVAARYWSTPKLKRELAPRSGSYRSGTGLIVPNGWSCDMFATQARHRIVLVCAPN